jgi:hypothetical protein
MWTLCVREVPWYSINTKPFIKGGKVLSLSEKGKKVVREAVSVFLMTKFELDNYFKGKAKEDGRKKKSNGKSNSMHNL